ncbi:MAG: PglZ domain-containing protein [Campylobacterota bacterium]|nr:PglZ domain-containing protein [Campylobacterota bacterium]
MINQWFKKDIDTIYSKHQIVVFVDESKKARFLLDTLNDSIEVYIVQDDLEELHVKYLIEKNRANGNKYLIYTSREKNELKFVREYCETNGVVEIKYLQNYIKDKLHKTLNLNLNMSEDELISAAQVSVGRDANYWISLSSGVGEIFDMEKELLPFLHDPKSYTNKYDTHLKTQFYKKINEHLNQDYIEKPAETLAQEVLKAMFDGLASGSMDKTLEQVYTSWLDSREYKTSFDKYLKSYAPTQGLDIWSVSPSHPFVSVDYEWLKEIGSDLHDKDAMARHMSKINQRRDNRQAKSMGIVFWSDVRELIEFDERDINQLSSLSECIEFYTKHLYKVDQAMRRLYTEFLENRSILDPYQEYYKNIIAIFLDKWFKFFSEYEQNQTGTLDRIIRENSKKIAVIVGDGVTYEAAKNVSAIVSSEFKFTDNIILVDTPSETENNMSQIYISTGEVESTLQKREQFLASEHSDKDIGFVYLDKVTENTQHQYLICQYKDIDELGDKMNNKALKYFPEAEKYFAQKIEMLLNNGYQKVYLITDHGFVLTGYLSESDKVEANFTGNVKKAERYIRTVEKQNINSAMLIEKEQSYHEYNYLYFSTTMSPFKTVGAYGFSHGGLSPQELITPFLCWETDNQDVNSLSASITNKSDLSSVMGALYSIKIKADVSTDNLFSQERKVYLLFFAQGKQISRSDIITLTSGSEVIKEYPFDGYDEIEVQLLDITTKEQLDRAVIKKDNARDFGGLL